MTGGPRAGRTLALALATAVAGVGLVVLSAPASHAAPGQSCTPVVNPCTTTTESVVTTTSLVATTTTSTVRASTTTTAARATTTTGGRAAATTVTTQQQTTTTLAPPGSNVLVPGDGTEGAQSTTTTVATATKVNGGGPSDGTLIGLVIAGLILIAIAVAVLTWRYWIATRPPVVDTNPTAKPKPTPARTG